VLSRLTTERPATTPTAAAKPRTSDGEIERLQAIIDTLRVEIGESPLYCPPIFLTHLITVTGNAHKQSAVHVAKTQALFDGLQEQHVIARARDIGEVSVDLMITPTKDGEKDRIEMTKRELEEERRKFTEAAVRLGREKATLEVSHFAVLIITLQARTLTLSNTNYILG
jgi:hypothetical protein